MACELRHATAHATWTSSGAWAPTRCSTTGRPRGRRCGARRAGGTTRWPALKAVLADVTPGVGAALTSILQKATIAKKRLAPLMLLAVEITDDVLVVQEKYRDWVLDGVWKLPTGFIQEKKYAREPSERSRKKHGLTQVLRAASSKPEDNGNLHRSSTMPGVIKDTEITT
ncbi:hypothetical protein ZWY2020_034208 [Hordeum vulgare]|nr:hypothetical protein ZWY2020_034208 [Hordeum vulgare]